MHTQSTNNEEEEEEGKEKGEERPANQRFWFSRVINAS